MPSTGSLSSCRYTGDHGHHGSSLPSLLQGRPLVVAKATIVLAVGDRSPVGTVSISLNGTAASGFSNPTKPPAPGDVFGGLPAKTLGRRICGGPEEAALDRCKRCREVGCCGRGWAPLLHRTSFPGHLARYRLPLVSSEYNVMGCGALPGGESNQQRKRWETSYVILPPEIAERLAEVYCNWPDR